jgi:hypothetical protein
LPKKRLLADCFVDAELLFCAGNFFEEFKNFFFGWCLDADTAVGADVYSVVAISTFSFDEFFNLGLCYCVPLSDIMQTYCAPIVIYLMTFEGIGGFKC